MQSEPLLDLFSWARKTDPITSKAVGESPKVQVRWGSQRAIILKQYAIHEELTDEEAGEYSGLRDNRSCCYWKRCSELRQMGLIKDTEKTKISEAGQRVQVCRITQEGIDKLKQIQPKTNE